MFPICFQQWIPRHHSYNLKKQSEVQSSLLGKNSMWSSPCTGQLELNKTRTVCREIPYWCKNRNVIVPNVFLTKEMWQHRLRRRNDRINQKFCAQMTTLRSVYFRNARVRSLFHIENWAKLQTKRLIRHKLRNIRFSFQTHMSVMKSKQLLMLQSLDNATSEHHLNKTFLYGQAVCSKFSTVQNRWPPVEY